jgi:hypothetical protein
MYVQITYTIADTIHQLVALRSHYTNPVCCVLYVSEYTTLHYMITNSAYVRVQGHDASADVTAVCMTYDGTWLLSAGSDGLLNVYRLRCYKLHHIHFLLVVNTTHTILYHTVMNHEAL